MKNIKEYIRQNYHVFNTDIFYYKHDYVFTLYFYYDFEISFKLKDTDIYSQNLLDNTINHNLINYFRKDIFLWKKK